MTLKQKIENLARKYADETIQIRRHLHSHPELSFKEFETSRYIQSILSALEIPFEVKYNTGVVALIKGGIPSAKVLALRADIDALPIQEANENKSYRSKNEGVMHACGHDVHTSSLLGVAKILTQLKSEFSGTVKLIFQPAEEVLPGGASILIKEGVLENPKVHAIIGQHVMPFIPTGKVGFRPGMYMASTDEIYMTITGKGGHGAQPHQNVDPVLIASHIIIALQQVVSRIADPRKPSVLSFGKMIAQGATNIIPDEVKIEGTFRTLDEEWRAKAHQKIDRIACGIAESMGAKCTLEIRKGYPYLINEENLTLKNITFAKEYLGDENVLDLDIWMAAEDFSFYSQVTDACFYRLGTGNSEKDTEHAVHTPRFDIDEDAIETSIGLMSYLALKNLEEN